MELLLVALVVAGGHLVWHVFAESQDAINATLTQQLLDQGKRLDRIETLINGVLVAVVIGLLTQIMQILRGPERRR